jgi:hypothetical protein
MRDFGRKLAIGAGVLALFCGLTWWLLHFRPSYAGTRLPSDLGDPVLVLYFMEWGEHCLARGIEGYREFWNAGFYYPAKMVMTFSDHVLGPAIQASVLHRLGVNEIGGYNFLFLGSFVLSGLTTTWVLRRTGIGLAASILGGIAFAFSPYRSDQRAHLQVLLMQWIPLVLWCWHRLLEETTPRRAAVFFLVYALHVTGGMYLAYLMHFALAIVLLQHRDRWRSLVSARSLRVLLPTVALCGALAAAIFVPYEVGKRVNGLTRGLGDVGYYGATLPSYLAIGTENLTWGWLLGKLARPENQLFAGLVTTVLAILGLKPLWSGKRLRLRRVGGQAMLRLEPGRRVRVLGERERMILGVLLFASCAGFVLGDLTTLANAQVLVPGPLIPAKLLSYFPAAVLALGGAAAAIALFRWWRGEWPIVPPPSSSTRWDRAILFIGLGFALLTLPVVFGPLQRVVPGLDGMRVPTRAYPFVSFALAFFAARGLDAIAAQGRRRQVVFAAVAVLLLIELRDTMPWHLWYNRDQIPPIFDRIAQTPDVRVVLHLPIPPYPFEAHYMYFSIANWLPIVNGYSGYEPPEYVEVKQRVRRHLFDSSTLDYLSRLGVTHIAVHRFQFKTPRERRLLARWEKQFTEGPAPRLEPVASAARDRLYRLVPPPAAATATASGEPSG